VPEIQDKEWAAFYLGQFTFAIIGPALAMDEDPIRDKTRRDWQRASEHTIAAAKRLNIEVNLDDLRDKKGSQAKHTSLGNILALITDQVEKRHGKPVADLVRLGNIAAACMAYDIQSEQNNPIRIGFLSISNGLGIPDSISRGFLDDPIRNSETFAAISVKHAKHMVSQEQQVHDLIEMKPGAFGMTVDVKKLIRHISRWFKQK